MELSTDNACNEHDYTAQFEVPLEAIKKEVVDEEEIQHMGQAFASEGDVRRIPIVLSDNKPKLRKKKPVRILPNPSSVPSLASMPIGMVPTNQTVVMPPKQTVLLPRPIMPKIDLPPPKPPGAGDPPANCKGVLIVQDVKFCTMYVPKSDGSGEAVAAHTFPVGALSKSLGVQPNLIPASAPASLLTGLVSQVASQKTVSPPGKESLLRPQRRKGSSDPAPSHSLPVLLPKASPNLAHVSMAAPLSKVSQKTAQATASKSDTNLSKDLSRACSPPSVLVPNSYESTSSKGPAHKLLLEVQKLLFGMLPIYWFTSVEKGGINVMLFSIGKEKAIQRRIYVSYGGNVEISVHCKPLPEYFVQTLVEKSGTRIRLIPTTVKPFSGWILSLVQVVRDLQVCTGAEHPQHHELFDQAKDIYYDENPFQECRFTVCYRSRNCLRLVAPYCRRCGECSKSFSNVRKRNIAGNQKKKSLDKGDESSESDTCSAEELDSSSEKNKRKKSQRNLNRELNSQSARKKIKKTVQKSFKKSKKDNDII